MKILKNKTYKDLLLKIDVLESDKVKLQKKCDEIQNELNMLEQRSRIKIDNLNERLQKAEAEAKKYFNKFHEQREDNRLLADERDELLSKLSRKGLGTKGSKKGNNKQ
jgi:predicted  nucleic acid-binding Zn-ribbon protein